MTLHKWPAEAGRNRGGAAGSIRAERCPGHLRPLPRESFDLTGNAAEWVVKTKAHPEACLDDQQAAHRYVVQGCYWGKCYRKPHQPRCGYVNCAHPAGYRSYEFGFRCCGDRNPAPGP